MQQPIIVDVMDTIYQTEVKIDRRKFTITSDNMES